MSTCRTNNSFYRDYSKGKSFNFSEWTPSTPYTNDLSKQDFVTYKGKLYACQTSNVNEEPSSSEKWILCLNLPYFSIGDSLPRNGRNGDVFFHTKEKKFYQYIKSWELSGESTLSNNEILELGFINKATDGLIKSGNTVKHENSLDNYNDGNKTWNYGQPLKIDSIEFDDWGHARKKTSCNYTLPNLQLNQSSSNFNNKYIESISIQGNQINIKEGTLPELKAYKAADAKVLRDANTYTNKQIAKQLNDLEIAPLIETTWLDLKKFKNANQLLPGRMYRITDYQTCTDQPDTTSADHVFDIIVIADDCCTLNEHARAIHRNNYTYFSNSKLSSWELWYCFENDDTRFAWASTNGRGVIYRMIDEYGNDCPYDFKNIKFDGKYTFDNAGNDGTRTGDCFENIIKPYIVEGKQHLNNIVLEGVSQCNYFGRDSYDNKFVGNKIVRNYFTSDCHSNTVISDGDKAWLSDNNILCNFANNTIEVSDFCQNHIGNYFHDNYVKSAMLGNVIGDSCSNNTIGTLTYNTIDCLFQDNTIGTFKHNTVGMEFLRNKGEKIVQSDFGLMCKDNSFKEVTNCIFEQMFQNNSFEANIKASNFGIGFRYNHITKDVLCCTFGNYIWYTSYYANQSIQNLIVQSSIQGSEEELLEFYLPDNDGYKMEVTKDMSGELCLIRVGDLDSLKSRISNIFMDSGNAIGEFEE